LKYQVRQNMIAAIILVWLRTLEIQKVQHIFPSIVWGLDVPETNRDIPTQREIRLCTLYLMNPKPNSI
jgi:hypothetical protein